MDCYVLVRTEVWIQIQTSAKILSIDLKCSGGFPMSRLLAVSLCWLLVPLLGFDAAISIVRDDHHSNTLERYSSNEQSLRVDQQQSQPRPEMFMFTGQVIRVRRTSRRDHVIGGDFPKASQVAEIKILRIHSGDRSMSHRAGDVTVSDTNIVPEELGYWSDWLTGRRKVNFMYTRSRHGEHIIYFGCCDMLPFFRTGGLLILDGSAGAVRCRSMGLQEVTSSRVPNGGGSPKSSRKKPSRCCWTVTRRLPSPSGWGSLGRICSTVGNGN